MYAQKRCMELYAITFHLTPLEGSSNQLSFLFESSLLPGPSRGGVTRVVTRGPGALRGPVENKVYIFGYEFSISSIGRAGP